MSVNKKLLYQQKFLTGKTGQSISTSSFTVKELWKKKNEREIFIPVYIYIYICIYICIYIYIYMYVYLWCMYVFQGFNVFRNCWK